MSKWHPKGQQERLLPVDQQKRKTRENMGPALNETGDLWQCEETEVLNGTFCLGLYWWDFRNPRLLKPVRKFGARKTPLLVKEDQVRKHLNKLDTRKVVCAEGVVQCCCEATLGLWKVMAIGWDSWGLKNTDVTYVCMNERRRIQGSAGQLASPLSLKADGANNSGNHFQTVKNI